MGTDKRELKIVKYQTAELRPLSLDKDSKKFNAEILFSEPSGFRTKTFILPIKLPKKVLAEIEKGSHFLSAWNPPR